MSCGLHVCVWERWRASQCKEILFILWGRSSGRCLGAGCWLLCVHATVTRFAVNMEAAKSLHSQIHNRKVLLQTLITLEQCNFTKLFSPCHIYRVWTFAVWCCLILWKLLTIKYMSWKWWSSVLCWISTVRSTGSNTPSKVTTIAYIKVNMFMTVECCKIATRLWNVIPCSLVLAFLSVVHPNAAENSDILCCAKQTDLLQYIGGRDTSHRADAVCMCIYIYGNRPETIEWNAIQFYTDIYGTQRMKH